MNAAMTQSGLTDVSRASNDGYLHRQQGENLLASLTPDRPKSIPKIIEALRLVTLLAGFTDEEYAWLATHGIERVAHRNAMIFRQGEPICYISFILRGEIQIRRHSNGPLTVFVRRAGQTGGVLPHSRMNSYGGDGICIKPVWALDIHKDLFPEMLTAIPSMGQRCISALIDRVREDTRIENKSEKCNVLGSLPANPAKCNSPDLLVAGDVVSGRFQIVRLLGEGGMGYVYQAQDLELGAKVAIKIIRPEISSSPEVLARFRREVKVAHRITHPNVCRTYDLEHEIRQRSSDPGNVIEIIFLTMEYLDGETLKQLLKRKGRFESCEAIVIASQIAEALTAAHQAGIVHRDIKPANVMVVPLNSGSIRIDRVVLTDFGLAKFEAVAEGNDASSISHIGSILGTVAYMAPEQLRGEAATIATDIYAFGLVLFEMVTGVRAFPDSQSMAAAFRRITQPPPSPRALVPSLTSEWEEAVRGCLEVDPASRFQRVTDAIAVLEGQRPVLLQTGESARESAKACRSPLVTPLGAPDLRAEVLDGLIIADASFGPYAVGTHLHK